LPFLECALADRIGIHHALIIPAICYLYILYYALWGSRPTPVVVDPVTVAQ
jgi:FHS family L-fucose permease-like MFS transporter